MRFWLVVLVATFTLLCGSASAHVPNSSKANAQVCHTQGSIKKLNCLLIDTSVQVAQKHHAPTPTPVYIPERAMRSHPSYFLHPQQQALYLLAYTLAQDTPLYARTWVHEQSTVHVPWFMVNAQPNSGLVDNYKPANLTYRSRLLYEQLPA